MSTILGNFRQFLRGLGGIKLTASTPYPLTTDSLDNLTNHLFSLSHSVMSDSATPWINIVHEILQAKILEWVSFPSPGDLPNPGIKPRCPSLQADSLPAESQGKPISNIQYPSSSPRLCFLKNPDWDTSIDI